MNQLLASLENTVLQLRKKQQEATKLRKKAENQLKQVLSTQRRSISGLNTIDRKIESEKEDVSDVSSILNQKNSQLESIERLIHAAEERLNREKETIEQTEHEIEFSENPEEKQYAESRLRSLKDHVEELTAQIASRKKTAKKITEDVAKFDTIKSKISNKIQKQSQSKPSLRDTMVSSKKDAQKFVKELEIRTKAEESAKNALEKASSKLKEFLAKKKTATKKKATKKKPARKTATKKKAKR